MKKPLQFVEGEQAVLGGMLIDNDSIPRVVEILTADDFSVAGHGLIYEAILDLFEAGQPVDWVSVPEILRKRDRLEQAGGVTYLTRLANATPSAANIMHYVTLVREKALRRAAIQASGEIATGATDEEQEVGEFLDHAEQLIFRISERRFNSSAVPARTLMKRGLDMIETLFERKEAITGVPSGFRDLDLLTAGFQPSDLIIVAARPSMGKTALALNMGLYAACERNIPTAVFSLEMSSEQIALRMLCARANANLQKVRTGFMDNSDWSRLSSACGLIAEAPLLVDDSPAMTSLEVRAKARRIKQQQGLGLLIIDYLQLMRGNGRHDSREREISEISRSLKALAKELCVPVIALSQLNRQVEQRTDKRPQLSDLRESGAIEQDADVIIFIYRDEVYNKDTLNPNLGTAEIIVGKQRNGPVGTVRLSFKSEWSSFFPLAVNVPAWAAM